MILMNKVWQKMSVGVKPGSDEFTRIYSLVGVITADHDSIEGDVGRPYIIFVVDKLSGAEVLAAVRAGFPDATAQLED